MPTKWTEHHFWSLDVAVGQGITIEVAGKTLTFSPLRYRQLGELVALARSDALRAWRLSYNGSPISPDEYRQRHSEMNAILFGTAGQGILDFLSFPVVRRRIVQLSLQAKHSDISEDVIDSFFDDETVAEHLVETILTITMGPQSAGEAEKSTGENPPGPVTDSAINSAPQPSS